MNISLTIPTEWNELNTRQLKKVAWAITTTKKSRLMDALLFFALLDIRWWQLRKLRHATIVIKNVSIKRLKEHFNWVYQKTDLTIFIPSVKVGKTTYHAPASRITDISIDEFAHADDLFIGWSNTYDIEYLQYLAAVLYTQKDQEGNRRIFNKNLLETKAATFKNVNKKTLFAILLSYQGNRNYLVSQFPVVFPQNTRKTKKAMKSNGFGKLILAISSQKIRYALRD